MIEVNLLPGGRKKSRSGPRFSLSIPDLKGGIPNMDPFLAGAVAAVVVALVGMAFLFVRTGGKEELELAVQAAVSDSARFADVIQQTQALQARRDSIAQRVAIIQDIDGVRYVWPHLLDEVARALPDFTWLTSFVQMTPGPPLEFLLEGRAANNFALTRFMENLEASPFITGVTLVSTAQIVESSDEGGDRLIYEFSLEARREDPPPEVLQTVPLFGQSLGMNSGTAATPASGGL